MNALSSEYRSGPLRKYLKQIEMKNAPKTIYLNVGYINGDEDFKDLQEVTWCAESNHEHDIEYQKIPTSYSELNAFLLVNFLRLPEKHQKSLIDSIHERHPELFPNTQLCESCHNEIIGMT